MSGPVTTYNNPALKAFSWSYSKLKNFETCAKRHYHYDLLKDVKEPESEELKEGFYVHERLALRLKQGEPLPQQLLEYEPWCEKILATPGKILTEQKLAIREDFSPCTYFDKKAWYRGVGDVIKINGPVALVIDWKTGKIVEDSVQLMLMAACVFAHHPEVQKIRSRYIWLKFDAKTDQDFSRDEMAAHWASLFPRIKAMKDADVKQEYPAKPGRLCKRWCAVTSCPHHGE